MAYEIVTDHNQETQSEFNAGISLAMEIHANLVRGNDASLVMNMDGVRVWWLHLENVYRFIAPRIKNKDNKDELEKVRVKSITRNTRGNNEQMVFHYRRKLTQYQIELEILRDKLGLGLKKGENLGMAILRG